MHDILGMISRLNRPKLLVSAARFGVDQYRRGVQLPRLLGCGSVPRSGPAVIQLLAIEAEMNDQRRRKAADYSIARHIDILIALMAEAQVIRAAGPQLQLTT